MTRKRKLLLALCISPAIIVVIFTCLAWIFGFYAPPPEFARNFSECLNREASSASFNAYTQKHFPDNTALKVLQRELIKGEFVIKDHIAYASAPNFVCSTGWSITWDTYEDNEIERIRNVKGSCSTTCL